MRRHILLLLILTSAIISVLMLFTQSIRLDESQSIWVGTKSVLAILKFIAEDVHVPLYFLTLHFWMQIFGTNIVIVRTLSLFFFVLTLPVLYILVSESSNKNVALLTIALFSLSPFVIWYAFEARMYTLFILATCVNHLIFLRLYLSKFQNHRTGFVISTIFGLYTHYFFMFVILTQIIFMFGATITKRIQKENLATYILLLFYAGIFFLPWVTYVVLNGSASNTQPLISPPTSYNIFQTLVNFLFGFQNQIIQSILVALWPLCVVFLFFVFTQKKHIEVQNLYYFLAASFLPIILVFLASYFRPIFLARYLIFVTPTFFFLLSWILLNITRQGKSLALLIFLVIVWGFLVNQNVSASTPVKEDYSGVDLYLEKSTTPKDLVAVSAPFTIYPIEYNYNGHAKIVTIPDWDRYQQGSIPPFTLQNLKKQLKSYEGKYNRVFVILSYDQGYEKDIRNYLDTHYQLLSIKKFSPGLESRVYKFRYE